MKGLSYKQKKASAFLALIVFIFVLGLLQKQIKEFFYSFSENCQKVLFSAGGRVIDISEIFFRAEDLQKENKILFIENQKMKNEIFSLKELKQENEFLREALKLDLQKESRLLLSDIVLRSGEEDFILIDKGKNAGVLEGMTAITSGRVLLGKVETVYEDFSKIVLITNKESSFPVKIQESNLVAEANGAGNLQILLDFIPQEKEIAIGSNVFTISLERIFPGGFLVGEIAEIQVSDLISRQKAKVRPAFNLEGLKTIFIVLD